jgi:hypothetical protein
MCVRGSLRRKGARHVLSGNWTSDSARIEVGAATSFAAVIGQPNWRTLPQSPFAYRSAAAERSGRRGAGLRGESVTFTKVIVNRRDFASRGRQEKRRN